MGRRTLALITVVVGAALGLAAGAGASTHDRVGGKRWTIVDLGTFGTRWTSGSAAGVNARGQVIGTNGTDAGKQRAFLWWHGKMQDLGTLGGRDSGASAINARGQVVGTSLTATPQRVHAFIWEDGKMTDLGTLGGKSSRPRALNDRGQVVGESFTASGTVHAFLWQNGKMTDLGTLGGSDSFASGINERGQIVGSSSTANGAQHAFLWQSGRMYRSRDSRRTLHEQHSDRDQPLGPGRGHELSRDGHPNRPAGPCLPLAEREDDRSRNARSWVRDERSRRAQQPWRRGRLEPLREWDAAPRCMDERKDSCALSRVGVRGGRRDQRSGPSDRRPRSERRQRCTRIRVGQRNAHGPRHARRCRE